MDWLPFCFWSLYFTKEKQMTEAFVLATLILLFFVVAYLWDKTL
jgi:hypothetical protein